MGNVIPNPPIPNPTCDRCKMPLCSSTSSVKREQFIEGIEYIVHKFSGTEKYFQLVRPTNGDKYYCFNCMFRLRKDPFQCPTENKNVERETNHISDQTDTSYNEKCSKQTDQIANATRRIIAKRSDFRSYHTNYEIEYSTFDSTESKIDKEFYGLLVKKLWEERIPLADDIVKILHDKLLQSNKNSIDFILVTLFYMFIQKNKFAQSEPFKNIVGNFNLCIDQTKSLRQQLISLPMKDLEWLSGCLIEMYVNLSYKEAKIIAIESQTISVIMTEFTEQLSYRDELSSFLVCLSLVCIRVQTHDKLCVKTDHNDQFQELLIQTSRNEYANWAKQFSKYYIKNKVFQSPLSQYCDRFVNIFHSNLWDVEQFDKLLKILRERVLCNESCLKGCLEVLQYHGLSPSDGILRILEEVPVKQIPSELEQVALQEKTVHQLLIELMASNEIPETLSKKCEMALDAINYVLEKNIVPGNGKEMKAFVDSQLRDKRRFNVDEKVNFLASAACAVHRFRGYKPRNVQLISAFLCLQYGGNKGILLQIHTGEGKSCVIAMIAATLVCLKQVKSVDILTSSELLATRDHYDWKQYFDFFGITTSKNVDGVIDNDCYASDIVFGTVETFSADILRHDFELTGIRKERQFEVAIVDEVDSMLVDKGIQFTYLSSMVAEMRHLEPILALIWYHASQFEEIYNEKEKYYRGPAIPFIAFISQIVRPKMPDDSSVHDSVKHLLKIAEDQKVLRDGFCKEYDKQIRENPLQLNRLLDQQTNEETAKFLETCEGQLEIKFEVYELRGRSKFCFKVPSEDRTNYGKKTVNVLSLANGYICVLHRGDLEEICTKIEKKVWSQLSFLKQELKGIDINKVPIPVHLKEHVETQLKTWISNAFEAKQMQQDREYLVNDNKINPVDFMHTGVIESNKTWGDGLQQFLEMKHSLALSPMTLVTNFISNIAFFKKYNRIYGLSGTIGSTIEEDFIETHYATSSFKIPTHIHQKLIDLGGVLKHSKEEWLQEICHAVERVCKRDSRAALVIVEDIKTAKLLKLEIEKSIPKENLKLYTRNETEEVKVIEQSLQQESVIIATNLAGRGTNITVCDRVNENGGLFVLVTFLPFNKRVELQAKGRTSRKGEPGSTQMILLSETLQKNFSTCRNFNQIMQSRHEYERLNMLLMKKKIELVLVKDKLFQIYCDFLRELCESHKKGMNKHAEKSIRGEVEKFQEIVHILHEKWGFWLKLNATDIDNKPTSVNWDVLLETFLGDAKLKLSNENLQSLSIYNLIKLGNSKFVNREYVAAVKYFTQAIETNEIWSSIAYYNRAFCEVYIGQSDGKQKAIKDLEQASSRLQYYFNELTVTMTCIQSSKANGGMEWMNEGNLTNQFQLKCQVLSFFADKIKKAIQKITGWLPNDVYPNDIFSTLPVFHDALCKDVVYEVWELGLTHIFEIEKPTLEWSQVIVISVGVAQVLLGGLLIMQTGILTPTAVAFICEGVSDIMTGVSSKVNDEELSMTSWSLNKAVALSAICLLPSVFDCIPNIKPIVTSTKAVEEVANVPAFRTALKVIGEEIMESFLDKCSKYIVKPFVLKQLWEFTRKSLKEHINPAMKTFLAKKEILKLMIRIESYSLNKENKCFNSFSKFTHIQCIGKDILCSQMTVVKENLISADKIKERLLNIVYSISAKVSSATEALEMLLHCDIGKTVSQLFETIFETRQAFSEGLNTYCNENEIPDHKNEIDSFLEQNNHLEDETASIAFTFAELICDDYANLIEQYVTKNIFDIIVGKVPSIVPQETKKARCYVKDFVGKVQNKQAMQIGDAIAVASHIMNKPLSKEV